MIHARRIGPGTILALLFMSACGSSGAVSPRQSLSARPSPTPTAATAPAPTPSPSLPTAAALMVSAGQLPWPSLAVTIRQPGFKDPGIVSVAERTYDPKPGTSAYNNYLEVDVVVEVTSGREHLLNLAIRQATLGGMTPSDATGPAQSLGNQQLGDLGVDTVLLIPERFNGVNLESYREVFSEGLVLCTIIVWARPGAVDEATAHRVATLEDALIKATYGTGF